MRVQNCYILAPWSENTEILNGAYSLFYRYAPRCGATGVFVRDNNKVRRWLLHGQLAQKGGIEGFQGPKTDLQLNPDQQVRANAHEGGAYYLDHNARTRHSGDNALGTALGNIDAAQVCVEMLKAIIPDPTKLRKLVLVMCTGAPWEPSKNEAGGRYRMKDFIGKEVPAPENIPPLPKKVKDAGDGLIFAYQRSVLLKIMMLLNRDNIRPMVAGWDDLVYTIDAMPSNRIVEGADGAVDLSDTANIGRKYVAHAGQANSAYRIPTQTEKLTGNKALKRMFYVDDDGMMRVCAPARWSDK